MPLVAWRYSASTWYTSRCWMLMRREQAPRPAHQFGSLLSSETSVAMLVRIDSRMTGIETRCRVSWMARQSSSESNTALPRLRASVAETVVLAQLCIPVRQSVLLLIPGRQ